MLPDLRVRMQPFDLPEWMDQPCNYEEFRACLLDLGEVNRLTLAARPTLAWLGSLPRQAEPLRILDIGSGGGDMLRRIEAWARKRGVAVTLTGIDLNPHAEQAAKEFAGSGEDIRFVTGDAFSYMQAEETDVVISSLLTHHLDDAPLIQLLAWMEGAARLGWFINDLHRSVVPYLAFKAVATAARWHPFVQHDGPVSFRRSFRASDWRTLCEAAGVQGVKLEHWTPGRLCVGRIK